MEKSESPQTFADLGLEPRIVKVLEQIGFTAPTPIQAGLIPVALRGLDCIGQARTGTGKTASFVLPIAQGLDMSLETVQALILCPTRELSEQVDNEFKLLSTGLKIDTVLVVGGRPVGPQIRGLQQCANVVIGTPGRVIDLIQRKALDLKHVRYVVLDEADRMLDIGFRKDIERILSVCSEKHQTMLLSATLDEPVEKLARKFMHNPRRIDLSEDSVVVETIQQYFCTVEERKKFPLLVRVLLKERPAQAIVFCRTKRRAQQLYERLSKRLPEVTAIHGDLQQRQRDKVIKRLREGQARLVLATDIVGRGIDISGISHIINYDIPESCDDYIHRVGRTGRLSSNSEGRAVTFVTPEQGGELTRIEMRINTLLEEYPLDNPDAFESREVQVVEEIEVFETKRTEDSEWDEIFTELT
ncbi:DEAD/DEAH box helicase [Planctomicrobium piriforme]|uniref:ATP-dependent RNA helicase DeaD n=1 Tax=Planctomicrobium piriforme TaxID=1576369 RepID=A0A1I3BD08_9PLAN|nr:DEAD/DEAH box helicase [Planctomicrobium piriforme]SFH60183.1 ATP-dependent RNA helicase DeaD [Planctomicrobium piriforme]